MKNVILLLLGVGILTACQTSSNSSASYSSGHCALGDSLAHAYLITDGHVDLPYRMAVKNFQLVRQYLDELEQTQDGDFDYIRAKQGGLDAPFMSIYIPSSYQKTGGAKAYADSLIDLVESIVARHPDKFGLAKTPAEADALFQAGKIALPMGMENGAPIENDLANVKHFHDRGIRYITLTHGTDNQICDSSYDTTRTWNGLSPFGEQVVKEMNRVGIMVDISHVSDSTFYDVMALTKVPVIASHSSARYFTPGFERNMNDEMLKLLGQNGGVIQLNFGSTFLDSTSQAGFDKMRLAIKEFADAQGIGFNDPAAKEFAQKWMAENGAPYATLGIVADHIEHIVKLIGIDHVAFGSDFDGVGDSLPTGLKDVSDYPNLICELLDRGFSPSDIEKICYKNVWRVWQTVNTAASAS